MYGSCTNKTKCQTLTKNNPYKAILPSKYPSVYQYLGVARYDLGNLDQALATFEEAVRVNDDDVQSWILLGNCYLYKLQLGKAAVALEKAVQEKGAVHEMHRLYKARNWMADWRDREEMLVKVENILDEDLRKVK